ncbi:MAG: hypothetical protein ACW99Q_16535, partial [Candidatus Kariarchaeaceae archaeon]
MATDVVLQEILYTETSGVVESDMFGCAFKTVSAETGFNGALSTLNITVVERNPGDFTLDQFSIGDLQNVKIGELSMAGFVDAYERTTIDKAGSGIYSVTIKDARVVMQSTVLSNIGTPTSSSNIGAPRSREAVRHNIINISGNPSGVRASGENREELTGMFLDDIIAELEGTVLYYGGREFELDLEDFSNLVDSAGKGVSEQLIQGKTRSLISVINEFTNNVGVSWWVEARQKSVSEDLWVISVMTVDRDANRAGDTIDVTLDVLAELHEGEIISRKDGFESNHTLKRKFIFGGVQRNIELTNELEDELVNDGSGNYEVPPVLQRSTGQFWGFDEEGMPLQSPAFTKPSNPNNRIPTDVNEMEDALNGVLNDTEDLERLRSLKRYLNTHWGRQFWYRINDNTEVIPNGWWVSRIVDVPLNKQPEFPSSGMFSPYPNGNESFSNDSLLKLSTEDGRYVPFVQLNEFSVTSGEVLFKNNGTAYREFVNHFINWTPTITRSHHIIHDVDVFGDNKKYMRCSLTQFGRYVVITLPVPLSTYVIDEVTGEINFARITRHGKLDNAWIPVMNRSVHYGPWTSDGSKENDRINELLEIQSRRLLQPYEQRELITLTKGNSFKNGRVLSNIDRDLVPWAFGGRGVTDEIASANLEDEAAKKVEFKEQDPVFLTGQLEVVGLPAINLSQPLSNTFGRGSLTNITEIYVRFDGNGITTRYTAALNSRDRKENDPPDNEQQQIYEEKDISQQQSQLDEDEFPEVFDDLAPLDDDLLTSDTDIEEELEEALEETDNAELQGPSDATLEYIYDKPDGGLGVISVKEGGPFYAVRRLDYQDIDPETYAGGFDITGSFFLSEWTGTRNLAEPENSPGLLAVGTRVTVSIFSQEGLDGPYLPYIEQTPQV